MTVSFLADENISPESAEYLEELGYSCHSILRNGLVGSLMRKS